MFLAIVPYFFEVTVSKVFSSYGKGGMVSTLRLTAFSQETEAPCCRTGRSCFNADSQALALTIASTSLSLSFLVRNRLESHRRLSVVKELRRNK